ncbi:MAG: Hsp70 family protein [Anaerolineales bacterium]|nr:Hsp70 family protein [Anaerolineales bacterium]
MTQPEQVTLFGMDCGATNWRLYRATYQMNGDQAVLTGDPQPAPLTSFGERKLAAILVLNPAGDGLEMMGEPALQQLENEAVRGRIREYFKPCIGSYLSEEPLAHQQRYTHAEALDYTRMLLEALVEQIRREKWRAGEFDERVHFSFVYPVHWKYDNNGVILDDFVNIVQGCFPEQIHEQIEFLPEPEGAILSLQRQGMLSNTSGTTMIVDVGGSTTDIVAGIVDQETGRLKYIGHYGEPFGGGLYDSELAKYISDELHISGSALVDDPSAMIALRSFARRLKESLSRQILQAGSVSHPPQRTITLVLQNGQIFRKLIRLDEAAFFETTRHLQLAFEKLIDNSLRVMDLKKEDIGQVVLVGGGSQLFTIVNTLLGVFGSRVLLADNPEEIVVHGACLQYAVPVVDKHESIILPPQEHAGDEAKVAAEEKKSRWWLVSEQMEFPLKKAGITRLGRARTNDFQLEGVRVSRFHGEIVHSPEGYFLVDKGSTNGTYLNEEKLTAEKLHSMRVGDKVRFGDVQFVVSEKAGSMERKESEDEY